MKKLILLFIATAMFIIACNKKSVPVITERKTEPSKPVTVNPSTVIPDTLTGKIVFTNRCGKCHGLPDPIQFTSKRWEAILFSMIPKAGLNEEQAVHITVYVHANAKK